MGNSASEQSWTDLLTNETFVHPLNDLVEPAEVINGLIPIGAVPPLIHEAAHHACLSSGVGLALAAGDLRALRLAESGGEENLRRAATIVLRSQAVIELYRPLLEGLALFAEFDALPGDSRLLSRPLLFTLRHTVGADEADNWQTRLFGVLSDARQTRSSFERRRDVLGTGLRNHSGYLLGYLFVKTWSRWAARQARIFRDPDFSFFFLSEYFWNDYELAALLLDETSEQEETLRAVITYCLEKLISVTSTETRWEAEADYFEEVTLGYELDDPISEGFVLAPPPFPGAAAEAGREQLQDRINSLPLEEARVLARRSMLHLLSLPITAEMLELKDGPRIVAFFRDRPMMIATPDPAYGGAGGTGTVDVFMEDATAAKCIALSVEGELAHLTADGRHGEYVAKWVRQFQVARGSSGHDPASSFISQLDGGELEERGARLVDAIRGTTAGVYARVALAWAGTEAKETLLRQPAAFRSLLGPDLVESLAILSSVENAQAYLEEVRFIETERDLTEAVSAIKDRLEPLGIRVVNSWKEQDEKGQERTAISVLV